MYTNILLLAALCVVCVIGLDEHEQIIFATSRSILRVEDGVETPVIPFTHNSSALDLNIASHELFWSDNTVKKIYKASLDYYSAGSEVVQFKGIVDGIAFDWLNNNLYWTDSEEATIAVVRLSSKPYLNAIIVDKNLSEPRHIALDPQQRLMFWTDCGEQAKIDTAFLDGSQRRSIVSENIICPKGLTLDLPQRKLFWINDIKIESCNYDGSDRDVLTEISMGANGITSVGLDLYYSDWNKHCIMRTEQFFGINIIEHIMTSPIDKKVKSLQIFNPRRQPIPSDNRTDECSTSQCSELCLHNQFNYTCFCKFEHRIMSDGHTCGQNEFLLSAWRSEILEIDVGESDTRLTDNLLLREAKSIIAIDFLHSKGLIFWSNNGDRTISQGTLGNLNDKKVIVSNTDIVDGLAVDWVCNNLYWTDTGKNTIEVQSLETGARKILYDEDLLEPRAIVLYPPEAIMFFTDWGRESKIESAAMDGSERHIIVKSNLVWPNGLALDWDSRRVYWIDGSIEFISSCNFDGSLRNQVTKIPRNHAFGITMNEQYIFYSAWGTNTIEKINRKNLSDIKVVKRGSDNPMGLKIYNSMQQPMLEKNPCAKSHCTHICLLTKNGESVCACPNELRLSRDKNTCVTKAFNENEEIEIYNFKFGNIGTTSVDMTWKASSNQSLWYFIKFECLKMARCQSECSDNTDYDQIRQSDTDVKFTVNELTAGAIYNVSIFHFERLVHTDNFTTLDTNEKVPGFLKEVVVLNSTSAIMTWQPVLDCVPVSYYFNLFKASDNSTVGEGTTNITSVTFVTLEPHTEYLARVGTHINGVQSTDYLTFKFTTNSGIEEFTVYKKTRKEIWLRWKIEDLLPANTTLKLNYMKYNNEPMKLDISNQPCKAWPDYYCYTLKNLTPMTNYTISIIPVLPSKTGTPVVTSAMTKEAAPSKPSFLNITQTSFSGISVKWGIPKYLNGVLRSFIINIGEVDKFLDGPYQYLPVMEIEATSDEPFYENEIMDLQSASTYEISVLAKTLYFGPPQILTLNTRPPSMKVWCVPNITVADWLPQAQPFTDDEKYQPLIVGYILMAVCIDKNHTDSGISDPKLNSELVELLGTNNIFFVSEYAKDKEIINLTPDKDVESEWGVSQNSLFTKGNTYKLAAVQISIYKDAYRLDNIFSHEFKQD